MIKLAVVPVLPSIWLLAQTPSDGFSIGNFLAQLGVSGTIVVIGIWIYRDVVGALRTQNEQLRKELSERTAKADEMNHLMMQTVAPAMAEMTRASKQVTDLLVRRGERIDPHEP